MAVQAINLKKGMIFSQDGKLIKVLKANHHNQLDVALPFH